MRDRVLSQALRNAYFEKGFTRPKSPGVRDRRASRGVVVEFPANPTPFEKALGAYLTPIARRIV